MERKKWQEWTIVAVVGILVVTAGGATYYFLSQDKVTSKDTVTTTKDTEMAAVDKDLKEVDDMSLSELDGINSELNSIDLSGI